ncbi:MAG: DNA repair protein RecN [Gammaproteobacteria bacterium]|nr:DNA repair protein RecN [Gammaproteobacteria bacterium]
MLTHIHIRDFAIVDEVDLDLHRGMTVLTGETGAGKSILLDALGLALGDRADSDLVRHGAERAEISVDFDIAAMREAQAWLEERELESGDSQCQLRRTISKDGRSRGYINGSPVNLGLMRELGEQLVDIHGQHEHQSLMRKESQRQLLDDYAQNAEPLREVGQAYFKWRRLSDEFASLSRADEDRSARQELLSFQVKELESLALEEGEFEALEEEYGRLANASQLLEACEFSVAALYESDEGSVHSQLGLVENKLDHLRDFDSKLGEMAELINSAAIQVHEAASELRHHLDSLELDPQRLMEIEQRLSTVHDLARKHHVEPESVHSLLPILSDELDGLQNADQRLAKLESEIQSAADEYLKVVAVLSERRRQSATELSQLVTANMQELGMKGGRFSIAIHPRDEGDFTAHGMEQVEYLVSANPGQPEKPLSKVASGGELSRISLAIQVIVASVARIPTLIFDEVDVGIGGGIAEIVGRKLRTLGRHAQVLCVTHQPQVAALANQHLQVSKQTVKDTTHTRVESLKEGERVVEVARMLGGVEITSQTLSHAKEMIDRSQAESA